MIFSKKTAEEKNIKEIGFEEREKRTPVVGYLLLIAMTIVVLWLGISALNDLYDVPQKPQTLSTCASGYISYRWEDNWHMQEMIQQPYFAYPETVKGSEECIFSDIEIKYGADKIFAETKALRKELGSLRNGLMMKQGQLESLRQQYGLGLTERIAVEKQPAYNTEEIKSQLSALEPEVASLQSELSKKELEFKPFEEKLKSAYKDIQKENRSLWRWHDFYAFLLQVIFVFPLFFLLLKFYFRLSAKNSPYLIIITFLLVPASIFVLDIVFVYFWGLFLGRILEDLWNFIKNIQILKSLISYLGMIIAALIFGGSVYLLQKKIFNPKRVALKHLRDKKCPNCSFSLDLSKNFCSNCGTKILEKCQKCGESRYADLPVCRYCGDKRIN
ncbi:zinc ribbon domain-containing protein [Candidatus Azambacteria bacterium]|nr:zinc ribbon domain-containing protein [Candidatus Azambacteria bacterium]